MPLRRSNCRLPVLISCIGFRKENFNSSAFLFLSFFLFLLTFYTQRSYWSHPSGNYFLSGKFQNSINITWQFMGDFDHEALPGIPRLRTMVAWAPAASQACNTCPCFFWSCCFQHSSCYRRKGGPDSLCPCEDFHLNASKGQRTGSFPTNFWLISSPLLCPPLPTFHSVPNKLTFIFFFRKTQGLCTGLSVVQECAVLSIL